MGLPKLEIEYTGSELADAKRLIACIGRHL